MTILSPCISEAHSDQRLLASTSSPFTEGVHREHTNPSTSGELSNHKRWGWEIQSNRFGFQRNHLESGAR